MSTIIEARLVGKGGTVRLAVGDRAVIDESLKAYLKDGALRTNDEVILTFTDKGSKVRKTILYIDECHTMVTDILEATIPGDQTPSEQPPKVAEFFLRLVARTNSQQAAIGDLNEIFHLNCAQHGRARATRLYWAEALRSLWPLLRRMVGRVVKWGAIVDAIKHHFLS